MDVFSNVVVFLLIILLLFIIILFNRLNKMREGMKELTNYLGQLIDRDLSPDSYITEDSESNHNDKEDPQKRRDQREDTNRDVLINTLRHMNCQPEMNTDQNIEVAYQGENFLIQFNGAFIRIWDLSWFSTKSTDDNFTLLKDAVNYANFSFGPTIIMHSPDENGHILLSSRMDVLFVPEQNDNEGYVSALLDSFFGLKQNLQREVARLKDNPQDRTVIDNPIGFDTATLSDPTSPQAN